VDGDRDGGVGSRIGSMGPVPNIISHGSRAILLTVKSSFTPGSPRVKSECGAKKTNGVGGWGGVE
jgi:hypothetical protein